MSSGADTTAEAVDERRQALLDDLRAALGDAVLDAQVAKGDICVRVDRAAWRQAAVVCRDRLDMNYFCFLSGIDWLDNPALSGEKVWDAEGGAAVDAGEGDAGEGDEAEPDAAPAPASSDTPPLWRVAGGDSRFQVFARLYSIERKLGITLKADLDDADLHVDSWVPVFRGADWHERETWEMYGYSFDGHPGLRHLYLPAEFEGHPLRKDFPLLAREVKPWPGLVDVEPMPGEAEGDGAEGGE